MCEQPNSVVSTSGIIYVRLKKINKNYQIIHPQVFTYNGFNRNWPNALRYGEHESSGIALIDLRVEQRVRGTVHEKYGATSYA